MGLYRFYFLYYAKLLPRIVLNFQSYAFLCCSLFKSSLLLFSDCKHILKVEKALKLVSNIFLLISVDKLIIDPFYPTSGVKRV